MCELFAMSSRGPATVTLSLERLARHGGVGGPHDGWGTAYYEDGDVRLIKDAAAASASPWLRFVATQPLRSHIVLSHIRRATVGESCYANTHPFARELGGRMHVFAHNGNLSGVWQDARFALGWHRPIGSTDSEYAFCALLARLDSLWRPGSSPPDPEQRFAIVSEFAADVRTLGPANFIYCDGDVVFAHGHRRRHADGSIRPPGLCVLERECRREDAYLAAEGLRIGPLPQRVVLLASVPLTDEAWRPLATGEVVAVRAGEILLSSRAA